MDIAESRFTVLDDVGSEADRFKNGISASRLRRVLAQTERRWMVITTNLAEETFLDAYDARASDRLRSFQWLEVGTVHSYRTELKSK